MKAKQNCNIPFTDKSINNAIGVSSKLLKPTSTIAPTNSATLPRVSEAAARVRPPRVEARPSRVDASNNDSNTDNKPARVLTLRPQIHQQKYSRGTRVYRIFGEVNRLVEHWGYICDFSKKEGFYKVKYQDGEEEIETMLHKTKQNSNILQVLAATKHKRIIEQYATMEEIYTPPSHFSGGYAKAMECIEIMALEAANTGFGKVGSQDYKWTHVVIDGNWRCNGLEEALEPSQIYGNMDQSSIKRVWQIISRLR